MIGRLRRGAIRRYELPLVEFVEFEPQDVPVDPYALGLLLGDGCLTTRTTPSFTTADPELAQALEGALPGIEVRRKGESYDYVLRHTEGERGGLRIANPVTVALRELGLAGTRSATKFVPDAYKLNSAWVRLHVLQGLLDTDGGPVTQDGRTCRVQYSTISDRLRDDVVFLVQSLGGVVYTRTRPTVGRRPGRPKGRDIGYRHDAHVLDIRLPEGFSPFRLTRKQAAYDATGGGRPMRFIDSIEPMGEQDTMCIQVAAEDSLYVTDDFLVTHNTLNDAFIILDEAQNTSPEQMKMFLTRLGFGSKIVVTGDVTQVDLPGGTKCGLRVVEEHPRRRRGRRLQPAHQPRRRPAPAGRQDRRGVRRGRRPRRASRGSRTRQVVSIEVLNESGAELDVQRLAALSRFVMDRMRVHPQAELCVKAVDEATIAELNERWMEKEGPTDVLAFPMDELRPGLVNEEPEEGVLGDLVLCPDGRRAAGRGGRPLHRSPRSSCSPSHGILHLLGYDHAEPEEHAGDVRAAGRSCWVSGAPRRPPAS